jgi:hypothetical protein
LDGRGIGKIGENMAENMAEREKIERKLAKASRDGQF